MEIKEDRLISIDAQDIVNGVVTIPSSVKVLESKSIAGFPELTSVVFSGPLQKICSMAITETGIEHLRIPAVKVIDSLAFVKNPNLQTAEFTSCGLLNGNWFYGCSNLNSVKEKIFSYTIFMLKGECYEVLSNVSTVYGGQMTIRPLISRFAEESEKEEMDGRSLILSYGDSGKIGIAHLKENSEEMYRKMLDGKTNEERYKKLNKTSKVSFSDYALITGDCSVEIEQAIGSGKTSEEIIRELWDYESCKTFTEFLMQMYKARLKEKADEFLRDAGKSKK